MILEKIKIGFSICKVSEIDAKILEEKFTKIIAAQKTGVLVVTTIIRIICLLRMKKLNRSEALVNNGCQFIE